MRNAKCPDRVFEGLCRVLGVVVLTFACAIAAAPVQVEPAPEGVRVLVFSKTAGFRHDSIPAGIAAIAALGAKNGFDVHATENAGEFTANSLSRFRVIVFLNTTGDVLNDEQQAAMEAFIRNGGGFVGIHAASDTEYDWEWYGRLVGARFASHPPVQPAVIDVLDRQHPSTIMLGHRWRRTDEWYNFQQHPSEIVGKRLQLLANLDEATYEGGTMGRNHSIAWCHEFDGGRSWYTAGGHTAESYAEPLFMQHILGGIQWASRAGESGLSGTHRSSAAPSDSPPAAIPPPPRPPFQTRVSRVIGEMDYRGESTWRGLIEVNADEMMYVDGTLRAGGFGVPQGITFNGNRSRIVLKNLKLIGLGDGINVALDQRINDVYIENCQILDSRTPDVDARDHLLSARGYGMFIGGGRNWTIRDTVVRTKAKDPENPLQRDWCAQYAARLGTVHGLRVSDSRFENWAGKASVWMMFVRDAIWDNVVFSGGHVRIGVRAGDLQNDQIGDCRDIILRNCTFEFTKFDGWPGGILIWPGCENIHFEDCTITTDPSSDWWLDIDTRDTRRITWKNITVNGDRLEGYDGVRTKYTLDEMKARSIGPASLVETAAKPAQ